VSEERGWSWYWLCVAAWAAMMGAWAGAADVLGMPDFTLRCGAVLVGAFPVAYYLHFTRLSRGLVNGVVLAAACGLGLIELFRSWLPLAWEAVNSLGGSYRLLISCFLWVMVWRSFAVRTEREMLETTLPVGSVLLLTLVSDPGVVGVGAAAVALLGCVALMAGTHEASWARPPRRVRALASAAAARSQGANSWPTVYLIGLLTALAATQGLKPVDLTAWVGRELQMKLSRLLVGLMLRGERAYLSAEPRLLLGPPAPSSNQVLLEIQTTSPANWRLRAYTVYDGRGWSSRPERGRKARPVGVGLWELPLSPGLGKAPWGERVVCKVTARVPIGGTAPALFWPRWLRTEVPMGAHNIRVDDAGSLWLSRYLRPGDSYEIVAVRPSAGLEPKSLAPALRQECLALPPQFPDKVRRLAAQVAAGKAGVRAKVAALETYLRSGYTYDPAPPGPPPYQDAVAFFLFESHRGYCVHFASALALMCRSLGIPARVVSGFLEGEAEEGTHTYLVRARDAHAWAEVFVPGDGWVEVDPTPPRPLTVGERAAQVWDQLSRAVEEAAVAVGTWAVRNWMATVSIIALLTGLGWLGQRWKWQQLLALELPQAPPGEQIARAYRQMVRWLELAGEAVPLAATPLEIAGRLGEEWGAAREAAMRVARAYTWVLFSGRAPSWAQAREAVDAARQVRAQWLLLRRQA
jgi:transglutaminase-like putative cysteine protease